MTLFAWSAAELLVLSCLQSKTSDVVVAILYLITEINLNRGTSFSFTVISLFLVISLNALTIHSVSGHGETRDIPRPLISLPKLSKSSQAAAGSSDPPRDPYSTSKCLFPYRCTMWVSLISHNLSIEGSQSGRRPNGRLQRCGQYNKFSLLIFGWLLNALQAFKKDYVSEMYQQERLSLKRLYFQVGHFSSNDGVQFFVSTKELLLLVLFDDSFYRLWLT